MISAIHSEIEGILTAAILENPEFLDRLAMRITKRIASGPSEGNESIRQIGDQYFTRYQLERFKRAFIFLMSQDEEFRTAIRKVLRKYLDAPVREALNRNQLIRRIQEFGPLAFMHKGQMRGFFASDVYAALGEYSQREVLQMLQDTGLLIRTGTKVHPKTNKNNRTFILDI